MSLDPAVAHRRPPVLFGNPQETKLDLSFRLLGFPVRVSPFFWIAAVLISPEEARDLGGRLGPTPLLIWAAVFFVSILLHELGHSLMHRRYGRQSHIVLHGFGGYAQADRAMPGPWPQIWVSLAGPGMNFAIAGLLWATNLQTGWAGQHEYLSRLYGYAFFANLGWGLFNLLPILPLDGGRICQEVCHLRRARQPEQLSLKISIGTCGFLILLGLLRETGQLLPLLLPVLEAVPWWLGTVIVWMIPGRFQMLFLFLLGYACWEALQQFRQARYFYDDDQGWR